MTHVPRLTLASVLASVTPKALGVAGNTWSSDLGAGNAGASYWEANAVKR